MNELLDKFINSKPRNDYENMVVFGSIGRDDKYGKSSNILIFRRVNNFTEEAIFDNCSIEDAFKTFEYCDYCRVLPFNETREKSVKHGETCTMISYELVKPELYETDTIYLDKNGNRITDKELDFLAYKKYKHGYELNIHTPLVKTDPQYLSSFVYFWRDYDYYAWVDEMIEDVILKRRAGIKPGEENES